MDFGRPGSGTTLRLAGWLLTFGIVLVLLQSAFWSERVPILVKTAVASIAILAATGPGPGLVALAALVPFGHLFVTRVWQIPSYALSESLVLAFLAGYLWHERRRAFAAPANTDRLLLPAWLFASVVVASCMVQVAVVQFWNDAPVPYASSFARFLVREYLTEPQDLRFYANGRLFVSIAALMLEGVALLIVTRRLAARDGLIVGRVTIAAAAAGAIAAVLTLSEPLALASATNRNFFEAAQSARWSSWMIPSVNTSAAYFVMIAFFGLSAAARSRRWMVPGAAATALCAGAVWLTQTQSALIAGLAVIAASVFWLAASRFRWSASVTLSGAASIGLAVAALAVLYNPLQVRVSEIAVSLRFRLLFAETAWRMIASQPITGVGIGQYATSFQQFASPELLSTYLRNDAHNYFLWLAAELGVVGLGVFLWLLAIALVDTWNYLRRHKTDYTVMWLMAGLAAFMITWASGQPLALPQAAYTFWIVLGCVSAQYLRDAGAVAARFPSRALLYATAAAIVVVVGTAPLRAARAIENIDRRNVRHGFHHVSRVGERRFQWAGPRIRFYMESSVRRITVPLAARHPGTPHGVSVEILTDGTSVRRVVLKDRRFYDVSIDAPISSRSVWRVDLQVEPLGVSPDVPEASRRIAVGDIVR